MVTAGAFEHSMVSTGNPGDMMQTKSGTSAAAEAGPPLFPPRSSAAAVMLFLLLWLPTTCASEKIVAGAASLVECSSNHGHLATAAIVDLSVCTCVRAYTTSNYFKNKNILINTHLSVPTACAGASASPALSLILASASVIILIKIIITVDNTYKLYLSLLRKPTKHTKATERPCAHVLSIGRSFL